MQDVDPGDDAGRVLVFDGIYGASAILRSDLRGVPLDSASTIDGTHSLVGDEALPDWAIGSPAPRRAGDPGRVSVVSGGFGDNIGTFLVADVTVASFVGDPGSRLGTSVHTGDLDGDGAADVLGGAPGMSCVLGVATPWTGEVAAIDVDWQFCGSEELGTDFALGDFDGDGTMDLAAGAPRDLLTASQPGEVYIWTAPARGRHDSGDAARIFGSGSSTVDGFGFRVGAADIDGDGRDDLAVSAPLYSEVAERAGAVVIAYGGGL